MNTYCSISWSSPGPVSVRTWEMLPPRWSWHNWGLTESRSSQGCSGRSRQGCPCWRSEPGWHHRARGAQCWPVGTGGQLPLGPAPTGGASVSQPSGAHRKPTRHNSVLTRAPGPGDTCHSHEGGVLVMHYGDESPKHCACYYKGGCRLLVWTLQHNS